jgi:uncharacterized protein (TIGR02145 family)
MHRILSSFVFVFVTICQVAVLSSCKKDSNSPTAVVLASLSTTTISAITSTTASSGGNISNDGGGSITARGVCWSTSQNPTIALTTKTVDGKGKGSFTSSITGLSPNTVYYVRAYATNSAGTAYGNQQTITSAAADLAALSTTNITNITATTAISGGNITSDGSGPITARGVCWSTSPNPTVALSTKTVNGNGSGTFSSSLTGLQVGNIYHVRAYATNLAGTAYGNEITFSPDNLLNVRLYLTGGSRKTWRLDPANGANAVTAGTESNPTLYYPGGPLAPCQINDEYKFTISDSMYCNFNSDALVYGGPNDYNCNPFSFPGGTTFNFAQIAGPGPGLAQITLPNGRIGLNISAGVFFIGVMDNVQNLYRILEISESKMVIRIGDGSGIVQTLKFVSVSPASLATLTTTAVSSITSTTASSGGNITSDGGGAITARGVVWSTNQSPTIALTTKTNNGTGTGSFTSSITGLSPGTIYYVRAYATNSAGTAYGNQQILTTSSNPVDVDGNVYTTVTIGTQVWMAENLKTTKYRNGNAIPTNLSNTDWWNTTAGACAIYNNDAANNTAYGKLYNWYAVADSRNLCPTGWHVPSDTEWKTLEISLGMSVSDADLTGLRGAAQNIGGKMKSTTGWNAPNTGATNESGFSGLPGGLRNYHGPYKSIVYYGYWWSSTEHSTTDALYRYLFYFYGNSYRLDDDKHYGYSVRCLRD